ncbi:MAG: bacterial regulatory helix-turn-helix, lysR family protein [Firmicutes bacterium]|nr:bacterial regulatory helix-turn-helix, lysR family protein [Bacillota bacterium]
MDIKQLRYFIAIVEEGKITLAAKRLHMAQPPLSRQLALMEEQLGVGLFHRKGPHMELTEAGKLLYLKAKDTVSRMEKMVAEVRDAGQGLQGLLTCGTVQSCISHLLAPMRYFRQHYPLISFKLWVGIPPRLTEYLDKRMIDFAILRPPFPMLNFSSVKLHEDPYVLAIPANIDPFYPRNAISIKELGNLPMALFHSGQHIGYNEAIINECSRLGEELNIIAECSDTALVLSLVRGGIAATILPKTAFASIPTTELHILDIVDFSIQSEIYAIWRTDDFLSKSAERFIELLTASNKMAQSFGNIPQPEEIELECNKPLS